MAWQNPITTWGQAGQTVPGAADFNRIEGNIQYLQDTKETPSGAQAKVDTHANLTSAHSATSAATANRIMMRDAYGRAKVAAPSASDDIARKQEVDTVQTNLNTHTSLVANAHGSTEYATAYRIIQRDGNGRAKIAIPVASDDIARKDTVDNAVSTINANMDSIKIRLYMEV